MKSITKYISLLAIAILAVSAFGTASAAGPDLNIIVDNNTPYVFANGDTFTNKVISNTAYDGLKKVFDEAGVNINEYITLSKIQGIWFINSIIKGGIALKSDEVIGEPVFNDATKQIDVHVNRTSVTIWN